MFMGQSCFTVSRCVARSAAENHGVGSSILPLGTTFTVEMAMTSKSPSVHSDPAVLGGTPVFVGTRVPAQSLFDYLEAGETLDEFLRQFPSVTRERALAALEQAREMVLSRARPA